jgi:predicted dehydrogenase
MMPDAKLGVGLLGCGAFGRFCLREFAAMPELRAAAVADMVPETARKAGEEFAVPVCPDIHALAARDDVQIIHIATPPSTHRELAIAALDAGKHVLCEKPLATIVADARRMIEVARTARRFLAVNLIMRYDPLNQAVARILETGLLGAPLHAFFENYAGDTPLGAGHWFWKPHISGGIFIEHGVHFFDLFRMWLGWAKSWQRAAERYPAASSTRSIAPSATAACRSRIFTTASTSPAAWRRRGAHSASAARSGSSNGADAHRDRSARKPC